MIHVTIYSQPSCHACILTKRHLDKRGIPYVERLIDDEVRAAAYELDITSAPIVCVSVNGVDDHWGGYRPDRIDAIARAA